MKKDTEYSETNKRVPLQVDLSQRNISTTADQFGSNNFIEKSKKDQRFTTKRPGIMLEISGSGSGQGVFAYNDIIYSWDNTLSPTAPVVTPLATGTLRYFVVRDYLDTADSEYRFIEVSPDALYIATGRYIGTGPYPYRNGAYLTASSSYIGPQVTRTAYNTVRYKALTHMAATVITGSGTIPTASLTTDSLWNFMGTNVSPGINTSPIGSWWFNNTFYCAVDSSGTTKVYATTTDVETSGTYSTVYSGVSIDFPATASNSGIVHADGTEAYYSYVSLADDRWFESLDGLTWTYSAYSNTNPANGIRADNEISDYFPNTIFGGNKYMFDYGARVIYKDTGSGMTFLATFGLSITSTSKVVMSSSSTEIYIFEFGVGAGNKYIKVWSSSDGTNWSLTHTETLVSNALCGARLDFNDKVYMLGTIGTVSYDFLWSSSTLTLTQLPVGMPIGRLIKTTSGLYSVGVDVTTPAIITDIYKRTSL